MKKLSKTVMLGCWGIGGQIETLYRRGSRELKIGPFAGRSFPSASEKKPEREWHLPPLARHTSDGIDLMPFILYDKVTIDSLAFECMLGARPSLHGWEPSKQNVRILEKLAADGYIIFEDYISRLGEPDIEKLIDEMVELDLSDSNIVKPCRESLMLWIQFNRELVGLGWNALNPFYEMMSLLDSKTGSVDRVLGYLYECVADINRVLVLSQILDQAIYEWEDYCEYYKYKFLRTGRKIGDRSPGKTIHELFNVFIPNFRIRSYKELIDIRHDHRLSSVRELVGTLRNSPIDKEIVIGAYEDVLKFKDKMETFSKYVGYCGYVLNVLPGVIGTSIQLAANKVARKWFERDVKWQTFFVEREVKYKHREVEDRLRQEEAE